MSPTKTRSVLGIAKPRLFTPPLRRLSPKTTLGYACIRWAEEALGITLMLWQKDFLKRILEINPDGSFRFRTVLLLVARQNGKTLVVEVLSAWLMVTRPRTMVLGTSTSMELAREPWSRVVEHMEDLSLDKSVKRGALDTSLVLHNKSRYKVASANRRGGRSLSVNLLLLDELREMLNGHEAWDALTGTTTAQPNSLTIALSNAGDDRSVVLNGLRSKALAGGDPTLGIFEWSAPENCELDDLSGIRHANPALGVTITVATLESKRGTMPPASFRTEHLCQRVATEDPAVPGDAWADCADPTPFSEALRKKVILGFDISPDLRHATLVAAAPLDDGRVRCEVVAVWDSTEGARQELPALVAAIKPRAIGWLPQGPAGALAPDLKELRGSSPLTSQDAAAICSSLSEFVGSRRLLHSDDPLLSTQVLGASKIRSGEGWKFARRGTGHCDSAYALAVAVHLVRAKASQVGRPRVLLPTGS